MAARGRAAGVRRPRGRFLSDSADVPRAAATARLSAAREALLAADVVCPHTDADGLGAGALALRARGEDASAALLLHRTETPWGTSPDLPDVSVALLDQGLRPFARRGVIIDHHAVETDDPGQGVTVLTSFGETPETPTAPLVRRALGEDSPAWLAALGAYGDLGKDGLALPECAGVPASPIRRLVPLINAPRRLPEGPVRTSLALLVEHDSPAAALKDPRIKELEECRWEWRAAFDKAVRTAPKFYGDVAVLRFDLPYQVHPLVAQTWSRRLAPRPVMAANGGWIPGRVNFSTRGGGGQDLRLLLRAALPDADIGYGHPGATGGSLPPEDFERLLAGLAA